MCWAAPTMLPERESRPAGNGPAESISTAIKSKASLPPSVASSEDWAALAAQVDGAFVVLVQTSHGRYRRRVWLTLAPAERAARKATEAGHNAVVILAERKPVYRVDGGGHRA